MYPVWGVQLRLNPSPENEAGAWIWFESQPLLRLDAVKRADFLMREASRAREYNTREYSSLAVERIFRVAPSYPQRQPHLLRASILLPEAWPNGLTPKQLMLEAPLVLFRTRYERVG